MFAYAPTARPFRVCPPVVTAIALTLVLFLGETVSAGSIFDDDFTPSAPVQSPSPALPSAPDANSVVPDQTAPNVGQTNPPPAGGGNVFDTSIAPPPRLPIPPKSDQAHSRSLMKEVYAKELADHSPGARKALGHKLMNAAATTNDNPTDQFVLLVGAMKAGEESADLPVCVEAAEQLGTIYSVSPAALIHDTALKMKLRPGAPADVSANIRAGLELVGQLLENEDFAASLHLIAQLQSLTGNAPAERSLVLDRKKEIESWQSARQKYVSSLPVLKTSPNDSSANFAVGSYLCLILGRWSEGLPMLANSSEPTMKALAARELARPEEAAAQLALAEDWLSAAKNLHADAALMQGATRRGLSWYHVCAPKLSGLEKIKAQTRFAEPAAAELGPPMIMKYVGDIADDKLYSLTDPNVPDELKVTQSSGKISISGAKKGDVATVGGHPSGHIGKAFAFSAKHAQGTATVGVSFEWDHSVYIIMLVDRNNKYIAQTPAMQRGEAYTWQVTTVGSTVKFTVTGANGDIATAECPVRDYKEFVFGAEARYPGESVDLTVLFQ